jgi:hypothetical protein
MRRLKNVTQDLGIEILRDSRNRKITGRKKSNLRHECEKKNPSAKRERQPTSRNGLTAASRELHYSIYGPVFTQACWAQSGPARANMAMQCRMIMIDRGQFSTLVSRAPQQAAEHSCSTLCAECASRLEKMCALLLPLEFFITDLLRLYARHAALCWSSVFRRNMV